MSTSILNNPLSINGVVSTDKTVLQNLNDLASAAGAFLTYDISQGKWAVIINKPGTSIKSYNDSNIIGSISVSETGVTELYNSVSLEFPHRSLRDQTEFVELTIPEEDRFPNEVDKTLSIQSTCINDPVQAQYIAGVELKQSRLNKIITFTTDYTSLGLKAGDLIDVTAAMYGYANKVFRVTKLDEIDEDIIGISITAMEYDADVYSTAGLVSIEKNKKNGILLKQQNTEIQRLDDVNTGNQISRLLIANAAVGLLRTLFSRIAGTDKFGPSTVQAKNIDKILSSATRPALNAVTSSGDVCEGGTVTITATNEISATACAASCLLPVPDLLYEYTITGISASNINVPLTGEITVSGTTNTGTLEIVTSGTAGADDFEIMTVTVSSIPVDVLIFNTPDYDYTVSAGSTSFTEGNGTTLTLDTINIEPGTYVPYTITGSTGRVTTPLSGTVTIDGAGQATLDIDTNTTNGHTGNDSFTVTFAPALTTPCLNNSITLTVNDSTAYQAPTEGQYVEVPLIWKAEYSGYDNQCQGLTVLKTARVPKALNGEATTSVPTSVSVSKGNPSTVTVNATEAVASSSAMGGVDLKFITTFNQIAPKGIVTGTTVTVRGYF